MSWAILDRPRFSTQQSLFTVVCPLLPIAIAYCDLFMTNKKLRQRKRPHRHPVVLRTVLS